MQVSTYRWTEANGWDLNLSQDANVQLVLVCADNPYFAQPACFEELKHFFPQAEIVGCSSSGNILGDIVSDEDIVIAAISFSGTKILVKSKLIESGDNVASTVTQLAQQFTDPTLKHLFVLSDGLSVSGTELTQTLNDLNIPVTGGLAGDSDRFKESWVMVNGYAKKNQIARKG